MALPTLITVKGTYLKLDGTPETGTIQFFSTVFALKSGDRSAVVPSEIKIHLDNTGSFEIPLPASNDPAWIPVGWTYKVVLRLSSNYSVFSTVIPYDAFNQELFITALLPAQPGGSALYAASNHVHAGYVLESTVDTIVADAIATTVGPVIDAAIDAAIIDLADDFALVSHTHAAADIVSGTIALARLPVGVASNQVAAGDHTHNYDAVYAPLVHNHNGVYSLIGHNHDAAYSALVHTHAYADITGTPTLDKAAVGLGNVDNTSDASKPVSTATQTALDLKAPIASPTFTGTVAGISKSMVGLGNADNTSDAAKPVSTAQQTALDLKANLASPTFTGTVNGITKAMVGLGSVDNTSDAGKPVSTAGQTALDLKANLASPTFTGTVAGITKSMVGLGNVDNTADSAKPISTATQTALDGKQASGSYALASDITSLDGRVDSLEDMTPTIMVWSGSAYVESTTARVYIGPSDPGSVPDGSLWIEVA